MLNDYRIFNYPFFYIVLIFVFQKLIIVTEIALGDDDQFVI